MRLRYFPFLLLLVATGASFGQAATPNPLHFWIWPSTIPQAGLQKAVEEIRASGIDTVADPAAQPWTHLLLWNSAHWILKRAGSNDLVELGWKLTAAALKQNVPAGAKVWVNLPPSQELGAKLNLREAGSMVQAVSRAAQADYVLTGTLTSAGPAWAWYRKAEFDKGPPDAHALPQAPGCSATSSDPVRTDWVPIADAASVPDAAGKLNHDALRLAECVRR
jgi:hypothetical protein